MVKSLYFEEEIRVVFSKKLTGNAIRIWGHDEDGIDCGGIYVVASVNGEEMTAYNKNGEDFKFYVSQFEGPGQKDPLFNMLLLVLDDDEPQYVNMKPYEKGSEFK